VVADFTTRPEILGTFGMVASTHWLATATGMAILERGGNAFDAAVAVGFALQVVEPHLNGPGGDLPVILYSAREDRVEVICGQGVAPRAATVAAYRDLGLDLVPGNGLLAAVVPGAFAAWLRLLRDHGTFRLRDVLAPAIGFARGGYPVVPTISASIARVRDLFAAEWPTSAAVYLPGDKVPGPGSLFRNPALADTYERILGEAEGAGGDRAAEIEAARRAWYNGFVAEAIDRFCRCNEVLDVTGRRHRGLLAADDLARWQATVEAPLSYDYHGYTLCKPGPWSQAPVALQQLALLKAFDLASLSATDPTFLHTVVECAKLAFADREAFYGDPAFVEVPMATLLSDAYNDERRTLIGDAASFELRPGRIEGYGGAAPLRARWPTADVAHAGTHGGLGEPSLLRDDPALSGRGDTCHVDVIDRHGNMVAATPSGGWLQSSPVIPELGFCLGTRAQMLWLDESHPAGLAPGKRPRTTLSPSLALRQGEPYLAFGTPGGDQQDQWALHVFLCHVHFGMNLQAAIDAPAFHTEHAPSSFYPRAARPGYVALEGRFPEATLDRLRQRGHDLDVCEDWSLGRVCAAARDGAVLKAAANPRLMQNYAIGR
jgi:gamma-glutamyltranspeptidase/glutathione hydrolase